MNLVRADSLKREVRFSLLPPPFLGALSRWLRAASHQHSGKNGSRNDAKRGPPITMATARWGSWKR